MTLPNLDDLLAEGVSGRFVLVRSDFNVPLDDGRITDPGRIVASLPTLKALADARQPFSALRVVGAHVLIDIQRLHEPAVVCANETSLPLYGHARGKRGAHGPDGFPVALTTAFNAFVFERDAAGKVKGFEIRLSNGRTLWFGRSGPKTATARGT